MKKLLALVLALALLPCSALAGGLPSLDGGLPDLTVTGDKGVVPDPADALGKGTVYAKDYQFAAGYLCTVYTYALPADADAFAAEYAALCAANGLTVDHITVEGYPAIKASYDGLYAMMLPAYGNVAMLMVQNGMVFGQPLPQGSYLRFTRNGRTIVSLEGDEVECSKKTRSIGTSRMFEISYFFREEPISLFSLAFPDHAATGDVFHVTKKSLMDGLYFYTTEEESLIFYNTDYHKMETNSDYFTVEITLMEKTADYVSIEGTFSGSFHGGKTLYEDGSFRVKMAR